MIAPAGAGEDIVYADIGTIWYWGPYKTVLSYYISRAGRETVVTKIGICLPRLITSP